jgi:hypothetical protein
MLALACAESHVPDDSSIDAGRRDAAVIDASADIAVDLPDEGPVDLGPRQDVGPLMCGAITASVSLENNRREEVTVQGEPQGHLVEECPRVGVRVTRDAARALIMQAGVWCGPWWELEDSVCYIAGSDWRDPAQADDFCWLDTLTGGEQEWVCQHYFE